MVNAQQMEASLETGDFPKAIDLCIKCQQDTAKYQQFQSLRGLQSRFQESFERIEEKLDNALLVMCKQFNPEKYEKILIGSVPPPFFFLSFFMSDAGNLELK